MIMPAVQVAFLGDIFLGEKPEMKLHSEVRKVLGAADLVVANHEGPIGARGPAAGGKCCLNTGVESARILNEWGVNVVSLANNHVFDHGPKGFEETRRALEQAGIRYLGAGMNLGEAAAPLTLEINGAKLGLAAYSDKAIQTTVATADSPGCAPLDASLMTQQLRELTDLVDVVVVLPHWGYCDYIHPNPEQTGLAEQLLAAGATAVVGHHSHVLHGLVDRGGRLVAYSLGNFAFAPFSVGGRESLFTQDNLEGVVLLVRFEGRRVVLHETVFTRVAGTEIVPDESPRRRREFERRSAMLVGPDYDRRWRRYVRRRALRRVLFHANILNWRRIRKETLIGGWVLLKGMFSRKTSART